MSIFKILKKVLKKIAQTFRLVTIQKITYIKIRAHVTINVQKKFGEFSKNQKNRKNGTF
jgi:type IV secretory pathway ATPase VirB11/archaellum biosynthesis ATPase